MEALRRSSRLLQRAATGGGVAPASGALVARSLHPGGAENTTSHNNLSTDAAKTTGTATDSSKRRRRRAVSTPAPHKDTDTPDQQQGTASLKPLGSITNKLEVQETLTAAAAGAGEAAHSPPAKRPRGRPPRAPTAAAAAAGAGAEKAGDAPSTQQQNNLQPGSKSTTSSSKSKGSKKGSAGSGPTRAPEQRLWAQGYKAVAGVDEAGRGPLAGPVVAAAAVLPPDVEFELLNDSKQMTEEQREQVYEQLTTHPGVNYAVAVVDAATIDKINILQAAMLAMRTAVEGLAGAGLAADHLLIDGNRKPSGLDDTPTQLVVKGDASVTCIAAASVLAKVTRDRMMLELDKQYPQYGFAQHKGYGVPAHKAALQQHGPCPQHRRSFEPVKSQTAWPGYPKPPPADAAGTVVAAAVAGRVKRVV